ncbi:TIM barrel protein [Paenibacillus sp. HB172176]|uniref:sugar phosphate isomerase/epimerase family protein n=1 Tax=Paenibacillus sp. HB172176 TaxID=2493690 RepID=UPI001439FB39|nr:TIM barrel protein [Paenibacillus sp. HB172176]
MSYLSISSWSLHRHLGPLRLTYWDEEASIQREKQQEQPLLTSLLELPREAARRGYQALEICHFHFPESSDDFLLALSAAFEAASISFDTLLLDYGDITSHNDGRRTADIAFIKRWIAIASKTGAKRIRVIAGEAPPTDEAAIALSAKTLSALADYASALNVQIITENFKSLTSTSHAALSLLSQTHQRVGFITDFGNYKDPGKLEQIAATCSRSQSIHVKPTYDASGIPDAEELSAMLETVADSGYNGAYVLIYDGPGDMWEGLERVKALVQAQANMKLTS